MDSASVPRWVEFAGIVSALLNAAGAFALAAGPHMALWAYGAFQMSVVLILPRLWLSGARFYLSMQAVFFVVNVFAGTQYFVGPEQEGYLWVSMMIPLLAMMLPLLSTPMPASAGAALNRDERAYVGLSVVAVVLIASNSSLTPIGFALGAAGAVFGIGYGLAARSIALTAYPLAFFVADIVAFERLVDIEHPLFGLQGVIVFAVMYRLAIAGKNRQWRQTND